MTKIVIRHPEDLAELESFQQREVIKALVRLKEDPRIGVYMAVAKEHQKQHGIDLSGLWRILLHLPEWHYNDSVVVVYDWIRADDEIVVWAIGPRLASRGYLLAQTRIKGKKKTVRPVRLHRKPDFKSPGERGGR